MTHTEFPMGRAEGGPWQAEAWRGAAVMSVVG
jgi:hypothetical protein